jgi:hypothetical protein
MGDATLLLLTPKHAIGDRDFLLGFLRDLGLAVRRVQEFPADNEAVHRLAGMLSAVNAFVEENNIQAAADAA